MSDFTTKAPETIDFEEEGLMVGLEFHQQILAPYNANNVLRVEHGSKLFCPCPAYLRDDEPDFEIRRHFRAVSGETGDIDITAQFERMKAADTIYEGYHDTTCLVELDEEPIHPINQEALMRTLKISSEIFGLNIVDEILVSRKTIIDGSNTSGFQRTALVAYESDNSYIDVDGKKISIYQANLEEDSAKNTGKEGTSRKFRLDRLGIPLIEVATGPDIRSPQEALVTASRIGELLRTTGYVKRGQGTIRQDLNVSIKRGTRIEIKGVSELDLLVDYTRNEAIRQSRMLKLLEIFEDRNISKRRVAYIKPKDLTSIFKDCKAKFVNKALKRGDRVIGARLPSCSGLLEYELQPGYRFGTELSEICKVTAKVGGILHSDELPKFGITDEEVEKSSKELNVKDDDGFFLVITTQEQGERSVEAVRTAFRTWLESDGLIPEVRAPRGDGTTGYLRPLPGKARMYPETDSKPIILSDTQIKEIENTTFEMPEERVERYLENYDLSDELADQLSIHPQNELFEELVTKYDVDATLVASTLLSTLVNLRREGLNVDRITRRRLHSVFKLVASDKISKDGVQPVLEKITEVDMTTSIEDIIEDLGLEKMDETEIEKEVIAVVEDNIELVEERGMGAMGTIMRLAMEELGGKAEGSVVSNLARKHIMQRAS